MATAILVGLVMLATALDRNNVFSSDDSKVGGIMAFIFIIALCVAIWTDIARAFK